MDELKERAEKEAAAHRKELRKHINKYLDDMENAVSLTEMKFAFARLANTLYMFDNSHRYRINQQSKGD